MNKIDNPNTLSEGVEVKTYAGCINVYENVFSKDIAQKIIDIIEEAHSMQDCPAFYDHASIGDGGHGGEFRSNLTMPFSKHQNKFDMPCSCKIADAEIFIRDELARCVRSYCHDYEVEIAFDEGLQILKYTPGKEYKAHTDYGPPPASHRTLSALIYLNPSEYEGGGTYFENFDVMIKPQSPSIALFPSNYAYKHRAKAVLDGIKYAVVTWLGPPWMQPSYE